MYIEGDPGRRVQYCESCKDYVKTVDLRESQRDVLLPLEDIVTVELDNAAAMEGLKAARLI
jgi:FdhE protein